MVTLRETLTQVGIAGQQVTGHGFAAGDREYEVIVEIVGPSPEGGETIQLGTVTLLFTLCAEVSYTARPRQLLRQDEVDHAGAVAEGDFELSETSEPARRWAELLGHPMYEATLRTSAYTLRLVFGDVTVSSVPAQSDWVGGAQA